MHGMETILMTITYLVKRMTSNATADHGGAAQLPADFTRSWSATDTQAASGPGDDRAQRWVAQVMDRDLSESGLAQPGPVVIRLCASPPRVATSIWTPNAAPAGVRSRR